MPRFIDISPDLHEMMVLIRDNVPGYKALEINTSRQMSFNGSGGWEKVDFNTGFCWGSQPESGLFSKLHHYFEDKITNYNLGKVHDYIINKYGIEIECI